jgi:dolichyl-phosphate-mannose--protein O-mannosyl transferase
LAVSTKWSALFVIAAFGLLTVWWDASGRRALGVRGAPWKSALIDGIPAFGYLVVLAAAVYLASWTTWLVHASEIAPALAYPYNGGSFWGPWVNVQPHGIVDQIGYAFRALWHYHQDVYRFHTVTIRGVQSMEASAAWAWPLLDRPFIFIFTKGIAVGTAGCVGPIGATCTQSVVGLGTPVLWWIGGIALVDALYLMLAKRDWRFTVPILGVAATWLPWLDYGDRPIYAYYAVAMIPFTVIGLVLVMERFVAPAREAARRVTTARVASILVVVLVIANFAWEWPVLTARMISPQQFVERVFFPNWRLGTIEDNSTSTSGGLPTGSTQPASITH